MLWKIIEQTKTGDLRVFSADELNRLGTATGENTHRHRPRADTLWGMTWGAAKFQRWNADGAGNNLEYT